MWCRGLGPGPAGEVYKSNSSLDLDHEIDILQVPYTQQQWIDMVLYQERFWMSYEIAFKHIYKKRK